jgi:hypothetical protein
MSEGIYDFSFNTSRPQKSGGEGILEKKDRLL